MSAVAVKRCTRCEADQPLTEFRVDPRYAGGHVNWCNPCGRAYRAEHYRRNREKTLARSAEWYAANKERHNATCRAVYQADPARHKARIDAAKKRDPERYREMNRVNAARRRAERVELRLRARISAGIRQNLTTGKGGRPTEELLGYSMQELRDHLERQFVKGMSWENMGEWHIDHILPISSFEIAGPDDPELRRAWALPNLRPLWAAENVAKSDKRVTLL